MCNEALFFAHSAVVALSVVLALRSSYSALLAVLGLQLILANLFVTKQIILFGIETTCSEVFIVGGMYGIALIRAYWGDRVAQQTVWYLFGFLLLFVGCAQLQQWYVGLDAQVATLFSLLCDTTPRLLGASVLAYLVSERVHLYTTKFLRRWLSPFSASIGAIGMGQLVDTVVFGVVGLYGLVESLGSVMLFSGIVKAVVLVVMTPLLTVTKKVVA